MGILKQQDFDFKYTIIGIDEPDEELLFLIKDLNLSKKHSASSIFTSKTFNWRIKKLWCILY